LAVALHPVDVADESLDSRDSLGSLGMPGINSFDVDSFDSVDSSDSLDMHGSHGELGELGSLGMTEPITIADRYTLEVRIGRGAAGSVYRAYDRKLDRRVAIKLLQPGEVLFGEREAQVLAKVAHRNVVTIHDFGHDAGHDASGHRYLVLELLEGCNFQEWLRLRPPTDEVIAHFVEAGRGLAAAHRAGFVHRDIKPSNLILTNEGRVVVIDFGLAQTLAGFPGLPGSTGLSNTSGLSPNQFTEGTLAYMAPERLAGHDSDERSDQFSFCVALWEGLSGSNPFSGADPLARYRSIRNGPGGRNPDGRNGRNASGPGSRIHEVPRHIIQALERGLSFDREQRFSTMLELLRELERPAPARQRKHMRPVLMSVAIAATFLFGWGFAPESATIEEANASLDPRADAAMAILESAGKRAAAGDNRTALNDLLYAADLITTATKPGDSDYCNFGGAIPAVAEEILKHGGENESRMAFGIASHFATTCANVLRADMLAKNEAIRASQWLRWSGPPL
jgi:predicted Ser/Thr protein kinase